MAPAAKSIDHWFREIGHSGELDELLRIARQGTLTLVYAARDQEHNDALVLRETLLRRRVAPRRSHRRGNLAAPKPSKEVTQG